MTDYLFRSHPSSLMRPGAHDPTLLKILSKGQDVSGDLLRFALFRVVNAVEIDFENAVEDMPWITLPVYIKHLVQRGCVSVPTLFVALVYLDRVRATFAPDVRGELSTRHRMFLISLMLASKYTQDIHLNNAAWAQRGLLFSRLEVCRMERQFLEILDYDLNVSEEDVLKEIEPYIRVRYARVTAKPPAKPAVVGGVRSDCAPPIALAFSNPFVQRSEGQAVRQEFRSRNLMPSGSACESPKGTQYVYLSKLSLSLPSGCILPGNTHRPSSTRDTATPSHRRDHSSDSTSSEFTDPGSASSLQSVSLSSDSDLEVEQDIPHPAVMRSRTSTRICNFMRGKWGHRAAG